MLKAVFRPGELISLDEKITIDSPASFSDPAQYKSAEEETEALNDIEEYKGPTADDLRREAEMFKERWEDEKERMFSNARAEAERIIDEAQKAAFQEVKRQTDDAQVLKQQAEMEAERIINEGRIKAEEVEKEIRQSIETERREYLEKGREEGREDGFREGKAEVERLIERTQTVLERAQEKRGEILAESEQEIIDLVLMIARKVVKVISENQRNVIIANIVQALRKVKAKGNVLIRVNMNDLQLATEHKQDFIKLLEGARAGSMQPLNLQVMEDSTVDFGGCIIETDFGEIDARISAQLAELENKILDISPLKATTKTGEIDRAPNLETELAALPNLMDAIEKKSNDYNPVDMRPSGIPFSGYPSAGSPPTAPPANFPLSSFPPGLPTADPSLGKNAFSDLSADDLQEEEKAAIANAALTASAAMAAIATLGLKGKRDTDRDLMKRINQGLLPQELTDEANKEQVAS